MPLIEFTNVIIDEFQSAKLEPNRIYMHILTHIHTGNKTIIKITLKDSLTNGTMALFIAPKSPNNFFCIDFLPSIT
jgi:hypothetical protein